MIITHLNLLYLGSHQDPFIPPFNHYFIILFHFILHFYYLFLIIFRFSFESQIIYFILSPIRSPNITIENNNFKMCEIR